ncbi:MAG: hypothetical protein H7X77_03965 [Anaerolineae bacterium]|nr:hypothetical protein [Anaerolineae bacterium]
MDGVRLTPEERVPWQRGQVLVIEKHSLHLADQLSAAALSARPVSNLKTTEVKRLLDNLQEQHKQPQVSVTLRPEVVQLEVGKPQSVQVRVRPQHTRSAFYELEATPGPGLDEHWYILSGGKQIEPGKTELFDLSITAQGSQLRAGQKYELILKVVARNQPDIPMAVQVLKLSVIPFMRFTIALNPSEISHRRRRRAALVITNNGGYTETFTILPESPDRLTIRPKQPEITIDAGHSQKIGLNFYPTRDAFRDSRLLFHIGVKTRAGMTERIHGSYLLPPRRRIPIWFWLLVLVSLVVAGNWLLNGYDPVEQFNFARQHLQQFFAEAAKRLGGS